MNPDALKGMVRVAAFAALTAALGLLPPVPVPIIPVPITAQTLGVMLAGLLLGPKRGAQALGVFLVLVALGFPLLSGGRGGLGVFVGPGSGFLIAWPLSAAAVGLGAAYFGPRLDVVRGVICAVGGGIVVTYLVGVPWMALVGGLSFGQALLGAAAFLPGDLIKAVLAAVVAVLVRRGYPALQA